MDVSEQYLLYLDYVFNTLDRMLNLMRCFLFVLCVGIDHTFCPVLDSCPKSKETWSKKLQKPTGKRAVIFLPNLIYLPNSLKEGEIVTCVNLP